MGSGAQLFDVRGICIEDLGVQSQSRLSRHILRSISESNDSSSSLQASFCEYICCIPGKIMAFREGLVQPLFAARVRNSRAYSAAWHQPWQAYNSLSLTFFPSDAWSNTHRNKVTKCSYDKTGSPALSYNAVAQVSALPVRKLRIRTILLGLIKPRMHRSSTSRYSSPPGPWSIAGTTIGSPGILVGLQWIYLAGW